MKVFLLVLSRAVLFLAVAATVVLAWGAYFHEAAYQAPPFEKPDLKDITVTVPALSEFKGSTEQRQGRLLVDISSDNNFELQEVNSLLVRVLSYGYSLSYLDNRTNLEKELGTAKEPEKKPESAPKSDNVSKEKLEPADALVVIAPRKRLTTENTRVITDFVKKGGRLLLISDPARPDEIGWLSSQFGLMFEKDYLYNMKENDGNFRNVFVTDFKDNEVTSGLNKVTLHTAGSISPADKGIAFTDNNTFSSLEIARGRLSPMALSEDSRVLAIADISFFTQPLSTTFDNDHLIANVAGWLTKKPSGG